MSEAKLGVRPDIGLNVSVFAHLVEYYGQFGHRAPMDKEEFIDIALVAETIGNMWLEHQSTYDGIEEQFLDGQKELENIIDEQIEYIKTLEEAKTVDELPEEPVEIEETPKPKTKTKAKASNAKEKE